MKIRNSTLPVLLALFSSFLSLQSQDGSKTDSLLTLLGSKPHDTTKVDLYIALHTAFNADSVRALDYIDKAIDLSVQLEDTERYCQSQLALGHFYYTRGLLSNAQDVLDQVREKLPAANNPTLSSSFHMEQGLVALAKGTFENAADSFLRAKRLFEVLGDTVGIGKCHTNLGSVYWTIGNLDKALEHYEKSLLLKHPDDQLGISKALGNLGLLERANNNFDQALDYYQRSLKICQENDFTLEAAINLQNIGVVYEKQKQYNTALDYFIRSNALSTSIDDKIGILYTDHGIATLYSNLGAYERAIVKLNEALDMAHELNIKSEIKNINQSLAETFERSGDYKSALTHQKNFELWKDSIVSKAHLDQVRELEIKYETEKKDRQIAFLGQEKALQEKETQHQATLKNTFIGGILLVTLLGALLFYIFRLRVRNQRAIAAKNQEIKEVNFKQKLSELERKALQAQINPHFIFNCMNSINEMILEADNKNASKYLTKFSRLIRLLLENAEDTEVSLKNELALLESYIDLEALRFNGNIAYQIKLAEDIDVENIQLPGMVLQPFVENAIWHGLRHKQGKPRGQIMISIKKKDNQLICHIEDNGIGREKAFELQQKSVWKAKSMGVKITEERLRLLSRELQEQLIKITDLKDGSGKARGTLVEVNIPIT